MTKKKPNKDKRAPRPKWSALQKEFYRRLAEVDDCESDEVATRRGRVLQSEVFEMLREAVCSLDSVHVWHIQRLKERP